MRVHTQGSYGAEPGEPFSGERRDPVEIVLARARHRLRAGDVVESSGDARGHERRVQVVRGGEVVAVFTFYGDGRRGWQVSFSDACAGIGFG